MSTSSTLRHRVTPGEQGLRLDRVLAAAWPELTRSRIQALISAGHVTVDGRTAKPSAPVKEGAAIEALVPAPAASPLVPEAIPLAVVHEDDDVLVLDKPPGLVVHPGAGVRTGTLAHALLAHAPGLAAVGGATRPGLVHRLDKDTSGLLVVAKTDEAFRALTADLAERRVQRRYLALVWSAPRWSEKRIDASLGRDRKERTRMSVVPAGRAGARTAATRVRVLARLPADAMRPRFALLACTLETGRTHQIRVHLAHAGHPVVGDATYGGGAKKALSLPPTDRRLAHRLVTELGRQALHAAELEFRHPRTGRTVVFRAPPPADFARALTALGFSFHPAFPERGVSP
jgi:23S rRNA pseudouridine1911/1915/1917 synthase